MHEEVPILRWRQGQTACESRDAVAVEEPMEIRVRGRGISVTMRTPGHDEEMAAGFLFSEGLIRSRGDIARIAPCERVAEGNITNVFLSPHVEIDVNKLTRHVFASSSCGLCGKASIEAIHQHFDPIDSKVTVMAQTLQRLPAIMRSTQALFDRTGGLHAAAVFDLDGRLLMMREDIGRHNAVDKVLGYALLNDLLPLGRHVLMVSGRASFEIMQKALAGRVPIVSAVSAPSSLAVEFARESGQTLVGFLREGRMNVYTGATRLG
ncbi:MAG: formate dehydrogenase accessory sulfurtransferase FdhD [Phycisphaeraceae bacterium]|nr:formate dehydrogenase accessory sulfurtransferase FdhD [Phycisphaeraceae bacterium]